VAEYQMLFDAEGLRKKWLIPHDEPKHILPCMGAT
jgi:hypothetical protein